MPTFIFRRPADVPLNSSLDEPQETHTGPTVIDPMFLPQVRREPSGGRKPGDVAKALLKGFLPTKSIKDGIDTSPRREQGTEDDTTIATESSPDSKRSVSATTPQKQTWLQSAGTQTENQQSALKNSLLELL